MDLTASFKPALSVVIVSYKVKERLRQCLESLRVRAEGSPTIEVVVVDNDSRDGTVEDLPALFPEVRFKAMDRNLGFSIGCNRGADLTSGEWILFLNPDAVVFPETLCDILAFARSKPDLGIAGCRILDGDGRLQLACRRSIPTFEVAFWRLSGLSFLFPRSKRLSRYNLTYLDPAGAYPVEAVSGSFLLIRTAVYREVGGFDEIFFLYGEDLDLCLRVARSGWSIWYDGASSIVHHKGQSAAARPWGARMDFYRAMVTFARKNFGVGPFVGGCLSVVASLLAAAGLARQMFQRWRELLIDFVSANLAFFLASTGWLWHRYHSISTAIQGQSVAWLAILSLSFVVALVAVGEYRVGGARRPTFATALGAALGVFLVIGFLAKNLVFSRASFVLGGALACAVVAARHLWSARKESVKPARAVVAGTGPVSKEIARRLQGSSRVRVLGLLSRAAGPSADGDMAAVVARLPNALPNLAALDVSTVIVPGVLEDAAAFLSDLAAHRQIRALLALPVPSVGEPVLVDVTLDHELSPERSE